MTFFSGNPACEHNTPKLFPGCRQSNLNRLHPHGLTCAGALGELQSD
jgi:hypothetical protein